MDLASLFTGAIAEHVAIIRDLDAQQEAFERAAVHMTECLLRGHKIF
jgi:hypothetical protein